MAKKKVFKSVIEPELFITTLEKHGAPQGVLQEFLVTIDDAELSVEIGKKVKCHKFVIDYYIKQRDRLGLLAYKPVIPAQSQDYFYLENAIVVIIFAIVLLCFFVYGLLFCRKRSGRTDC